MDAASSQGSLLRRDPRTDGWPLVGNVQFIVLLLSAYVYVVKIGGPRFMKHRPPTYLGGGYNIVCQGIDFDARDDATINLLFHYWIYFWVRVADFLDTLFFVLRKKESHVSTLHVVHHVLVVFNGWFGLAYGSDGHSAFAVIFNSFVHIVMYSYYFLSLFGPSVRKHLWWKRYLTQFQMIQFVILIVHVADPAVHRLWLPPFAHPHRTAAGLLLSLHVPSLLHQCLHRRQKSRAG
ncbi:hypothetical protein MTO96_048218 [Rhipicephalus appendiculatus]